MTSTQQSVLPVMKNTLKLGTIKKVENKNIKTGYVDDTNRIKVICSKCGTAKNIDVA